MTDRILQLNNEILGNHTKKRLFYILSFGLGLILITYSYLIGAIIFSAVVRDDIEVGVRDLEGKIGILEVKYLDLSSKITPELAHSLGFKEATAQVFTSRRGGAVALSLRADEN